MWYPGIAAVVLLGCALRASGQEPGGVNTSTNPWYIPYLEGFSAGPDGPWNVIQLNVDFPIEHVLVYPGGVNSTFWVSASACNEPKYPCPPPNTELWTQTGAESLFSDDFSGEVVPSEWDSTVTYPMNVSGYGHFIQDRIVLFASDPGNEGICETYGGGYCYLDHSGQFVSDNMTVNYPGGSKYTYTMNVGLLSLAASGQSQTLSWTASNGSSHTTNQTLANGYLQGFYPSMSYGLHIGSWAYNVSGSLWLGGFDQARVLTDPVVSTQQWVNLIDVGIGVASGSSPFPGLKSGQASGLLHGGGGTLNALPNPAVPYMYLPGDTCKAVAAHLPVTFNADLNLYTWNTDDPSYQKIITSPSYMSFEFNTGSSPLSTTIYIPFALLNLNLTQPLADIPTPYFPCSPFTTDPNDGNNLYHLGRAFLQGAFLSQNWGPTSYTFLAQAPGPAVPDRNIVTISGGDSGDSTLPALDNAPSWSDTWKGVLTPLPVTADAPAVSQTPSASSSDGLSTGAKTGIGVGVALGVVAIVSAIVAFLIYRRRQARKDAASSARLLTEYGAKEQGPDGFGTGHDRGSGYGEGPGYGRWAGGGPTPLVEAENRQRADLLPQEVSAEERPKELPGEVGAEDRPKAELPGEGIRRHHNQ